MENSEGLFIAIEGGDGAGKSTQFELLLERLKADGRDVVTYKFPRYNQSSSYFVREYLKGAYGPADTVGPYTAALFYALDRYEAAAEITEALQTGKIVLVDRYAGSNMAHQGAKFTNLEERRGFFIWLDNLEFEMLKVPRPTLNLVLRVPSVLAEQLLTQTGKERDVHESSPNHMEQSASVFEDLTELFPRDFHRIDCVRDGKLMPAATIHELIWQKIVPLLPVKSPTSETKPPETVVEDVAQPQNKKHLFAIEGASDLLIRKLGGTKGTTYEQSGKQKYVTPTQLKPETKQQYQAKMDQILDLHDQMMSTLTAHLAKTSSAAASEREATVTLRAVLPVATTGSAKIDASDALFEELICRLISDPLPEARQAGKQLLLEARKLDPGALPNATQAATSSDNIHELAQEYLGGNHTDTNPVQLVSATPRNELDILPDILFEHTAQPIRDLQSEIALWPYTKKSDIFLTYLKQPDPKALKHIHYDFDIVCDYQTLRTLQAEYPNVEISWQALTPRYGYELPAVVDQAGLSDSYEQCFDISLGLYSLLQEAGYPLEAQYATLQGHKLRAKVSFTALQAQKIVAAKPTAPSTYADLLHELGDRLSQIHPLIGESGHD